MPRPSLVLIVSAVLALPVAAAPFPAAAQCMNGACGIDFNPGRFGLDATTPSRIDASRREMNRGRRGGDRGFRQDMMRGEVLDYAARVVRRAGFICTVLDAQVVARSNAHAPIVEVDCQEGGGMILADTSPIQATDCLDVPEEGIEIGYHHGTAVCSLPGNVASVAIARQTEAEVADN